MLRLNELGLMFGAFSSAYQTSGRMGSLLSDILLSDRWARCFVEKIRNLVMNEQWLRKLNYNFSLFFNAWYCLELTRLLLFSHWEEGFGFFLGHIPFVVLFYIVGVVSTLQLPNVALRIALIHIPVFYVVFLYAGGEKWL